MLVMIASGGMLLWPMIGQRWSTVREVGALEATQLINRRNALMVDVREGAWSVLRPGGAAAPRERRGGHRQGSSRSRARAPSGNDAKNRSPHGAADIYRRAARRRLR